MRALWAGILTGVVVIPALCTAADPKGAEALQALQKEYEAKVADLVKRYRAAGTPEEQKKILADAGQLDMDFAPRFLALARQYAKEPTAIDVVQIILAFRNAAGPAVRQQALELLVANHLQSEKLDEIFPALVDAGYDLPAGSAEKLLRSALEKSPHRAVRGRAAFNLGQYLKNYSEIASQLKHRPEVAGALEEQYGKEALKKFQTADPARLGKQAEDALQEVVDNYALVRSNRTTLGKEALADLFELRNLAYGKVAPDIDGADIDGKKFKLSDYRGKVVVISFWGNW